MGYLGKKKIPSTQSFLIQQKKRKKRETVEFSKMANLGQPGSCLPHISPGLPPSCLIKEVIKASIALDVELG